MAGVLCNVVSKVRTRATPKRPRLVFDRTVIVGQLQLVVSNFLENRPTRDLNALVQPIMASRTWKTSPTKTMKSLYDLADLFRAFLFLCPNSAVPRKNLIGAIEAVHVEKPCMFVKRSPDQWAISISDAIRISFSKIKELKDDPALMHRACAQVGMAMRVLGSFVHVMHSKMCLDKAQY